MEKSSIFIIIFVLFVVLYTQPIANAFDDFGHDSGFSGGDSGNWGGDSGNEGSGTSNSQDSGSQPSSSSSQLSGSDSQSSDKESSCGNQCFVGEYGGKQWTGSDRDDDFELTLASSPGPVSAGSSITTSIKATKVVPTSVYGETVAFSCSGLPSGATCYFSPDSCLPECSTSLRISTSASTPSGSYTITITGNAVKKFDGSRITKSIAYTLKVISAAKECLSYCSNNTFYPNGNYSISSEKCLYSSKVSCSNGCNEKGTECAKSTCPDYCFNGTFYSGGMYAIKVGFCNYLSSKKCEFGCDKENKTCTIKNETKEMCQFDTDGSDYFAKGSVGNFKKGYFISKDSIKQFLGLNFSHEDKCTNGKTLVEYTCPSKECIKQSDLEAYVGLESLSESDYEKIKDAACVLHPYSGGSNMTSTIYECKCGCDDGACLPETDIDKDGTPDCKDADIDGDGMPNKKDNCPTIPNKDQKDINNDTVGNACDCYDVFQSEYEKGVDCGGPCGSCVPCDWCEKSKVSPIRIKGKPNEGYIDIVFIPEQNFTNNMSGFNAEVLDKIRNWYFRLGNLTVKTLPGNYKDMFNFYQYTGGFGAYKGRNCSALMPPNFENISSFYDVAGVLIQESDGFACAFGPPSYFAAKANQGDMVTHETGHALFGLTDEYCGPTIYKKKDPFSNVWYSLSNCQSNASSEGWNNGVCTQIQIPGPSFASPPQCTAFYIGNAVWRYDRDFPQVPLNDLMTCCGSGIPYRFWEADTRRILYTFNAWPSNHTKGILLWLHIKGENITQRSAGITEAHPDMGMQYESYRVDALGSNDRVLASFGLWDPRIILGDPESTFTDDIDFPVRFPFYPGLKKVNIYNSTSQKLMISVDLSKLVDGFCSSNAGSYECSGWKKASDANKTGDEHKNETKKEHNTTKEHQANESKPVITAPDVGTGNTNEQKLGKEKSQKEENNASEKPKTTKEDAVLKAASTHSIKDAKAEVTVEGNKTIYVIKGKKQEKVLGLIDIVVDAETSVDADTGNASAVKTSLFGFNLGIIEPLKKTGCGDTICNNGETEKTCPNDCKNPCGDGVCDKGEDSNKCPQDCKPPGCGDKYCGDGETAKNCPDDCSDINCGNGFCEPKESPTSCKKDCCGSCGDGKCIGYSCGENAQTCAEDCGTPCGNNVCEKGENPENCAPDCKWQACGDSICTAGDGGPEKCPVDCGTACGDGVCDKGEGYIICPVDCGYCGDNVCSLKNENPSACPQDCKAKCGNGKCEPGETTSCLQDCKISKFENEKCGDGRCTIHESKLSCPSDCKNSCGDGICDKKDLKEGCAADCEINCGDGKCSSVETPKACPQDCPPKYDPKKTDMSFKKGKCGNSKCDNAENYDNCPLDCNGPPFCGNGKCEPLESPETCAKDCAPQCGNNVCDKGENPQNCPWDCGYCGDSVCSKKEINACDIDCKPACGNGICESSESAVTCRQDCK